MDERRSRSQWTAAEFKSSWSDSGFWSTTGYDGLSIVFDLSLEAFQALPEKRKRALMRLLEYLTKGEDYDLQDRIMELGSMSAEDRLSGLVDLCMRFDSKG